MKLLTIVPVIFSPQWVKRCLENVKGDLIVIDNGATPEVKEVIKNYRVITNDKNIYVNPVWNQAMQIFLCSDYTHLCLLSSDVVMMEGWEKYVEAIHPYQVIVLPEIVNNHKHHDYLAESHHVECFAGIFFLLDKKMAEICYPIPEQMKIWFGDNWIQKKLEAKGYQARVYHDLHAIHGNSESVRGLGAEATPIIEQDKIEWQKLIEAGKI